MGRTVLLIASTWRKALLAFVLGGVTHFAFAPYSLWPLALLTLTGLFLLLNKLGPKAAAGVGFSYGFGLFAFGISWIQVSMAQFGGMPTAVNWLLMGLLSAYLALFFALTTYTAARLNLAGPWQQLLLLPACWLLFDWARGHIMTGFPWLWMGYSQIDSPLSGYAPIFGVQGVTLACLLIAGSITWAWQSKTYIMPLLVCVAVFGLGAGLNTMTFTQPQPTQKVALVQGNIEQKIKWEDEHLWPSIFKYYDLSQAVKDVDIVIWPESAIAAFEFQVEAFLQKFDNTLKQQNTALITGVINYDRSEKRYYNTLIGIGAIEIDKTEVSENQSNQSSPYFLGHDNRYFKHHLLPIGEFVPFETILRPLAPYFNLPMSSFNRGDYVQPNMTAKGQTLAPAICYEIAYSEQLRKNIGSDTSMILTVSNDAWFGTSIGPHQHLEIAQMRALEFGKPVLRATNTGVTAFIDQQGQLAAVAPQFEDIALTHQVTPMLGQTPYNRFGSWPLIFWVIGVLMFTLIIRRKKAAI
ncbi:apolipoprotein N-acyltransferase [Motilimonas pumila]|uniref:Apolipoprotein N-acyltransferase n=1 Tax=Motilimonas pumila TaxID=2303987 RepID=A0A418YJS7_9GAMM|nr:apolipoprotein N-acyltransferase [Motilimonas pumila]RJG51228.1 apolipoprotein N-acyltransferase [Motilimonas pumila]